VSADIYELAGGDLRLSLNRSAGTVDFFDEDGRSRDGVPFELVATDEGTGLHVTATLLLSSRNGTRETLNLLIPDVTGDGPQEISAVAVVVKSFHHRVGGPPDVLQGFATPQLLTGTAR
jgi:hypothetical protein